ncbi:MAG: sn-glycerol-1-phosphate dehydrogenase [Tannerella sp.]|jgi:glycerol-1-phosphate dehydrogenase [NAD(P)+]|nr:sn-glycerol-1-phosphate dehydrogenase [Tannerella sp.]
MNRVEEALKSARETKILEIGSDILSRIPAIFAGQFPGKKAIIVADTTTFRVAGEAVLRLLKDAGLAQDEPFIFTEPDLHAEYHHVEALTEALEHGDEIPVAVGSGTINDLCKLASHHAKRSYFSVATAASMDGYTSYGASIIYRNNKQTFMCPAPQVVIADIDIIRRAPAEMSAAGYADLFAKVPAGADWILADELGIEPMESTAWAIVQDGLQDALADPEGVQKGEEKAISSLVEGLMLGGFAMQWSRTSRPASGAEHQFSHLWDMEHHTHNGIAPSHGFKVGIATLYVSALYEQFLQHPIDQLDIEACCAQWPEWEEQEARAKEMFANDDFIETVLEEMKAKYITKEALAEQLTVLKTGWSTIRDRLRNQLLPSDEVRRRLQLVGAPSNPDEIGIGRDRMRDSFLRAQHLRSRFTILDVAVRTGCLEEWVERIL